MVLYRRDVIALGVAAWFLSTPLLASDPQMPEVRASAAKPRTERVLDSGVWVTRTYDDRNPAATKKIEAAGEAHTFYYDETVTTVVGKTVEVAGATLSLASKPGWVTATGLPDIAVRADDAGRIREIATPGGTLASFRFDPDGRYAEITLRGGLRLLIETTDHSLRQTLVAPDGHILSTSALAREVTRGFVAKFNLDMLSPALGLSYDWGKDRSLSLSRTGLSESIAGPTGEPLIRILRGIATGKAFVDIVTTSDCKPIAYRVTLSGMAAGIPGFPWRVLVTPDQGISLDAPSGPRGSVISLWSRAGSFGFRIDKQPTANAGSRAVLNMALCFSSVCTSSGSTTTCDWEPYWCDDGSSWGGGGGGTGGGGGGGGGEPGGGGGGPGTGERPDGSALSSEEESKLNPAENEAYARLDGAPCLQLFADYGQPPNSQQGYLNMSKSYFYGKPGSGHCPDDYTVAATTPNEAKTYLCPRFFSLSLAARAITLIHEGVHTAGLLGHAGLTSEGFQNLVANRCPPPQPE